MFRQVVIWGHKFFNNHCHTHAYEHLSYKKTFESMGYSVLWLDDSDDVSSLDFRDSLFVTIGGADSLIPIRQDCRYIIHNPNPQKYASISDRVLVNQIFTVDVLDRDVEKIYEPFYFQKRGNNGIEFSTLYHPWCSDILPHEIEFVSSQHMRSKRKNIVNFVGTVYPAGWGTNIPVLMDLKQHAMKKYGAELNVVRAAGLEHIQSIRESLVAPAIQGLDHAKKQFAVSRPYKIASYGRLPCTNCKHVYDILEGHAGYSESVSEAFDITYESEEKMTDLKYHQMLRMVSEKFTYKSQVEILLKCL